MVRCDTAATVACAQFLGLDEPNSGIPRPPGLLVERPWLGGGLAVVSWAGTVRTASGVAFDNTARRASVVRATARRGLPESTTGAPGTTAEAAAAVAAAEGGGAGVTPGFDAIGSLTVEMSSFKQGAAGAREQRRASDADAVGGKGLPKYDAAAWEAELAAKSTAVAVAAASPDLDTGLGLAPEREEKKTQGPTDDIDVLEEPPLHAPGSSAALYTPPLLSPVLADTLMKTTPLATVADAKRRSDDPRLSLWRLAKEGRYDMMCARGHVCRAPRTDAARLSGWCHRRSSTRAPR